MTLKVSKHAAERYIERLDDLVPTIAEAKRAIMFWFSREVLDSDYIETTVSKERNELRITFTDWEQTFVIRGNTVVTCYESPNPPVPIAEMTDALMDYGACDGDLCRCAYEAKRMYEQDLARYIGAVAS